MSMAWKASFGFLPILTRGDFKLCQSQAITMYAQDIALMGHTLMPHQRAFDLMMVAAQTDVVSCCKKMMFNKDNAEVVDKAKAMFCTILRSIEKKLPCMQM